jgi:hypothetical protein
VESEPLDANLVEDIEPLARVRHHEVAVEKRGRVLAEASDGRDAEGDVRDKVAVHDVNVENVRTWERN